MNAFADDQVPNEPVPELLTLKLNRLLRSLDRQLFMDLAPYCDLNLVEWRVLGDLAKESPLTVRALSERLDINRSEASRGTTQLIKRGFVLREDHPTDQRSALFDITPAGRTLVAQIMPRRIAFMESLLVRINPDDQRAFERTLNTLTAAVDEALTK